jgi:SET domain
MTRFPLLTLLLFSSSYYPIAGFQIPRASLKGPVRESITELSALQLEETTPREYNNFVNWAGYYGVYTENGFQITEQNGDWSVMTNMPIRNGARVLFVPAMLTIASQRVRQEDFAAYEATIAQYFDRPHPNALPNDEDLAPKFYLFLKILQEYELGDQSPYFAWMDALPRKFSTAVDLDDFELDCLPPFVASLARNHRINFDLFLEVLQNLPLQTIREDTKTNLDVTKWAYNVVFTRCQTSWGEAAIIPMADMFNHAAESNVDLVYDNEGNSHVITTRDVQAGEPLFLSYGQPTNPSRFLAYYGFFDQSPPATFCKLLTDRVPSQEIINLGFDYNRMVFWVKDGGVAEEVWDVMLYTVLGKLNPQAQQQFYQAHMMGDYRTKENMHQIYVLETCQGLLEHVNRMLEELETAAEQMDEEGMSGHNNLLMIRMHNDFVRDTFQKVKSGVEFIEANEKATREMVM